MTTKIVNLKRFLLPTYFLLAVLVFAIGGLFKIQHWVGAGIVLVTGNLLIIVGLLYFTWTLRKTIYFPIPIFLTGLLIGILFRIQHWPYFEIINAISFLGIYLTILFSLFWKGSIFFRDPEYKRLGRNFILLGTWYITILIITFLTLVWMPNNLEINGIILGVITVAIIIRLLVMNEIKGMKNEVKFFKFLLIINMLAIAGMGLNLIGKQF